MLNIEKQEDSNFLNKLERALEALGGRASGSEIASWMLDNLHFDENILPKTLKYKVNAILSSALYSHRFEKEVIQININKKVTIWSLKKSNNLVNQHFQPQNKENDLIQNDDSKEIQQNISLIKEESLEQKNMDKQNVITEELKKNNHEEENKIIKKRKKEEIMEKELENKQEIKNDNEIKIENKEEIKNTNENLLNNNHKSRNTRLRYMKEEITPISRPKRQIKISPRYSDESMEEYQQRKLDAIKKQKKEKLIYSDEELINKVILNNINNNNYLFILDM